MPSPFPGINPYIESRGLWPDFHHRVIAGCGDALGAILPDNYAARIEEQIRLIQPEDEPDVTRFRPDVAIVGESLFTSSTVSSEKTATLEPTTMTIALQAPFEVRETWIEIIRYPERSLVTVIEVLSPTNKDANGGEEYLQKRRKILGSPSHLVEIDLLIRGSRPPMSHKQPWPPGEYYALISKTEQRPDCQVYGWSIRRPIPPIPIPLAAPDPDVILDLSPIITRAYELGRYGRDLRYDRPLGLPLDPEELSWAEGLVTPAEAP